MTARSPSHCGDHRDEPGRGRSDRGPKSTPSAALAPTASPREWTAIRSKPRHTGPRVHPTRRVSPLPKDGASHSETPTAPLSRTEPDGQSAANSAKASPRCDGIITASCSRNFRGHCGFAISRISLRITVVQSKYGKGSTSSRMITGSRSGVIFPQRNLPGDYARTERPETSSTLRLSGVAPMEIPGASRFVIGGTASRTNQDFAADNLSASRPRVLPTRGRSHTRPCRLSAPWLGRTPRRVERRASPG